MDLSQSRFSLGDGSARYAFLAAIGSCDNKPVAIRRAASHYKSVIKLIFTQYH